MGSSNADLGGAEGFCELAEALHRRGMGLIVDVVSNHMSATPGENAWWNDVLENGPASPYAPYFNVDWRPVKEELQNRVLLPILREQYGQVLESGELKLEFRDGAFFIRCGQTLLPLEPRSYQAVLGHRLDALKSAMPADSEDLRELESVLTALEHLPKCMDADPARVAERQREKEVVKDRLRRLVGRSTAIAEHIAENVQEFNGSPEEPRSYDRLDHLLDRQVYRLVHWKAAADEINYRRFFDVNELAAVCMEDPQVFEESHRLAFDLLVRGDVDGLRIDHIDGLYDPMRYLRNLQRGYLTALGRAEYERRKEIAWHLRLPSEEKIGPHAAAGRVAPGQQQGGGEIAENAGEPAAEDWPPWSQIEPEFLLAAGELFADGRVPLYVVVEKILGPEEPLPEHWLVAGTTGYDFLNSVGGLFVDPSGLGELTAVYNRFIDHRLDYREVAYQSKLLILRAAMASEVHLLAHRLNRISSRRRWSRDFTLNAIRVTLREILACFPVYRTYIREGHVAERDRQFVCRAAAQAKRRNPAMNAALFDFIRDVLLLELPPALDEAGRRERELFVGRFQQTTSPVMAKGIEDTAFYRYCPLLSLNEVGGAPAAALRRLRNFIARTSPGRPAGPARLPAPARTTRSGAKTRGRESACSPRFRTVGGRR